ncbi:MAG: RidA family protein [Anaerolineaceae bacterium]|nr:RidA family protein [Anaerolineaceae bacterium]
MKIETVNPNTVHKPIFSYSHAVKAGSTIYVSMQLPLDIDGKLVGAGDPTAQAEQVFTNLKNVLEAAGSSLGDVVKLTTFLLHSEQRPAVMEVRKKYFGEHKAPSVLGMIKDLSVEGALVQVDAIAVVGEV